MVVSMSVLMSGFEEVVVNGPRSFFNGRNGRCGCCGCCGCCGGLVGSSGRRVVVCTVIRL